MVEQLLAEYGPVGISFIAIIVMARTMWNYMITKDAQNSERLNVWYAALSDSLKQQAMHQTKMTETLNSHLMLIGMVQDTQRDIEGSIREMCGFLERANGKLSTK